MADSRYHISYYGWMDENGQRHNWPKSFASGRRPKLDNVYGIFVKLTSEDDPEDIKMFWAYGFPEEMEDGWASWLIYVIGLAVSNYGYELAD